MSLCTGPPPTAADVVVVGSGFGGSVVAERLSAAGLDVCLLERGRAYPPGSYPRTPNGMGANFWSPSDGLYGMFDAWSFTGLDALISSGLGGGSLIYANVMLRKDPSWFQQRHPYQPGVIEKWAIDYDMLEPHYSRIEKFLDVQEMPFDKPDFQLPKTAAMRDAGAGRGDFELAPLAVRFRDADGQPAVGVELPPAEYPNIHGRARRTCRLLGECDIGCNEGAKSSLDHTFLSAASHHGATIQVGSEVRSISRRDDGGFDVGVVVHDFEAQGSRPRRDLTVYTIKTPRVVMSAGTLGTTYLLLANRARLDITTPELGTRFSGNGDLLGFILDADRPLEGTRGPVITSYLRYPDEADSGLLADYGMYLEDAGYPAIAAWMAELTQSGDGLRRLLTLIAKRAYSRATHRRRTSLSADVSKLLGPASFSENALPLLGMGRDIPDGTLYLREMGEGIDPVLDNTWTIRTSTEYFATMIERMSTLAGALGGRFELNPSYLLRRVITVHPVGGCPMPTTHSKGVIDALGRVHGVPGLYVADGSVFPGPVGANPSLTIAAFADRVAENMIEDQVATRGSL
ncbi:GMC oxidoreductase [Jatrophihabitans sp.]|uniref:GMC oxidoreductase n=1 Tax=Jatrophihabitans sp. TaxID=1932789 RepID=UPI002F103BCE